MRGARTTMQRTLGILVIALAAHSALAQQGVVLAQELDASGRGYSVVRVWGSHEQMGYAQAGLLGDAIVQGVQETKDYLGAYYYNLVRNIMSSAWWPDDVAAELAGMVACLAESHPGAGIDVLDLKVVSTAGEWLYGCRSHTCWGRYVAAPVQTLSTRRLDFGTVFPTMNHHVFCVRVPDDGSPAWVNLSWPGMPTVATAVNEFGTLASLHDYNCATDFAADRLPRMLACRLALTQVSDPDPATHLASICAYLQGFEVMTGSFVNVYVPAGHGGVMVCHPYHTGADFYYLRGPHPDWHHGEAMITTNAWTDGSYTPADEDFSADEFYDDETPKTLAQHWDLLAPGGGLHQLSVAFRARADMTIWADGRIDGAGRTPRLEAEWSDLVGDGDLNCDGTRDFRDINPFALALANPVAYATAFPDCRRLNADCNHDGAASIQDINAFVALLAR